MDKSDPRYIETHKKLYCKILDELDSIIIYKIMQDPNCIESITLNAAVNEALKKIE